VDEKATTWVKRNLFVTAKNVRRRKEPYANEMVFPDVKSSEQH